jgi:hypothetical protein
MPFTCSLKKGLNGTWGSDSLERHVLHLGVHVFSASPGAGEQRFSSSLRWRERNLLCPCTSAHLLRCRCLRCARRNANNIGAITVAAIRIDLPSANTTFTPRSPTTTHRSYVSERHNYAVRVPFFCKYHQTIGPFILPAPKTVAYSPMRRASAGRRNELCCGRQIGGTLSARAVIVPGQDFTANCVVSGNSPRRWACHLSFRCYNVGKTVSACAVGAAHNLKYSFVDI